MYENLKGKKLLFLGAIRSLCEPIKIAKEMGIYTIAIDYLPNSPAKKVADEAHLISTTDVDAVVEFCKDNHVDGLFTAFMDSMLPYARKICDRLGFPFYASEEQIKLSLDKRFFKAKCREYGVPVPKDYTELVCENKDYKNMAFPVVVKPIDYSGGNGVSICNSQEEFNKAYDYAMSQSPSKHILVEEYVKGDEITATYTMKDGEVSLSGLKDKFLSLDHDQILSQDDVLLFPSRHLQFYWEKINPCVIRMLKGMNATDGMVFFQGIATKDRITFFECGYRPNGDHDYRHIEHMNGINPIKMMLAYALTGKMEGYELSQDNPFFTKYVLDLVVYAHGGTIDRISGIEEIRKINNVFFAEYMHDIGDSFNEGHTLSQRVFRAYIADYSIEQIKETIKRIQKYFKIIDTKGNNMCYLPFDVNRLDVYPERIVW